MKIQKIQRVLKYIYPEIKKHKWKCITICFFTIMSGGMWFFIPFTYKNIAEIISLSPNSLNIETISHFLFLLGGTFLSLWLIWRVIDFTLAYLSAVIMKTIEQKCFTAIQQQNSEFFANTFTGSLVKKASRFVRSSEAIIDNFLLIIINKSFQLTIALSSFFFFNTQIAIFFSVWVILFIGSSVWIAFWKMQFDEDVATNESKISALFADIFGNIQSVKIFAQNKTENDGVKRQNEILFKKRIKAWFIGAGIYLYQSTIILGFEYLLVTHMIEEWKQGTLDIGMFVFFQTYILHLFTMLWNIGREIKTIFSAFSDAQEMVDIFENNIAIQDKENAKELDVSQGKIEFKNISFQYEKGAKQVFDNFSLTINPGEKVAIVGHSGSGKSTLVNLLFRFYQPQYGLISIDDQDITQVTQDSLRKNLSLVPQAPEMFHRNIADNIRYAKPESDIEVVISAAKKAQAHEFISQCTQGYETLVGERGVKLSGGERQRIAIARVILENSKILILDEATSALDSITEQEIQNAIESAMENKTSIIIAHRLSTIKKVDKIILLDKGQIKEIGTLEELLSEDGIFAQMWNQQSNGFLAE